MDHVHWQTFALDTLERYYYVVMVCTEQQRNACLGMLPECQHKLEELAHTKTRKEKTWNPKELPISHMMMTYALTYDDDMCQE